MCAWVGGEERGLNIGQDRTRCKIWNQQVILFLEFVMAPASFSLSLPQKLSHWKGAMRSQKVVSYLTCWLSFPPCSPRYAPLNHSVLCYFLSSHFLLLSNSFLFFLTLLFSSGSVASSLHLSELLVISQLSQPLRALAFSLLVKRAFTLREFSVPVLKQTHFDYFNKVWLWQIKSIKELDLNLLIWLRSCFTLSMDMYVSKAVSSQLEVWQGWQAVFYGPVILHAYNTAWFFFVRVTWTSPCPLLYLL